MRALLFNFLKVFHKKLRYQHLIAFLKYNSFLKIKNLIFCEFEGRRKKIILSSKPFLINSEPTNFCNFHCPFCPTGKKSNRPGGFAEIELYKNIFKQMGSTAYLLTIHGWGEPLMVKNLPEIIRLANKNKICTVVSTNGSLLDSNMSKEIISSQLDCLIFSIDGISEKSYQEYRKGGEFETVLNNMKELISLKKIMGSSTPFIEWQFLVFKHNEHEIQAAKQIAREIGVDNLVFLPAYTEDEKFDATDPEYRLPKGSPLSKPSDCKHLWSTLSFHWNGTVVPCCYDYPERVSYGNLYTDSFDEVWNNTYFQQSRKLVLKGQKSEFKDLYCIQCLETIGKS